MTKAPILPSNKADPTGADRLERGAMNEFKRRIRLIRAGYIAALNRIPAHQMVVNKQSVTTTGSYAYLLDDAILAILFADTGAMVDEILLGGGVTDNWFFRAYVGVAVVRGTAQTYANLAHQSPAYSAGRQSLEALLRSDPYRARVALVRARVFEEMEGLAGDVRANMARILADGIGRGKNPREIARNLTEQAGIEARRANRIARTEITTALRRARMDEADAARDAYGIVSKQMHISALSPTTRITHAARHAKLYTTDEQRDWWSQDANSINCKCSTAEILVDDEGKPLVPAIIERARKNYDVMKEKGKGPWAKD